MQRAVASALGSLLTSYYSSRTFAAIVVLERILLAAVLVYWNSVFSGEFAVACVQPLPSRQLNIPASTPVRWQIQRLAGFDRLQT